MGVWLEVKIKSLLERSKIKEKSKKKREGSVVGCQNQKSVGEIKEKDQ